MIPIIFSKEQAGPVLGWTSAIAAYGAYLIPKIFGSADQGGHPGVRALRLRPLLRELAWS